MPSMYRLMGRPYFKRKNCTEILMKGVQDIRHKRVVPNCFMSVIHTHMYTI